MAALKDQTIKRVALVLPEFQFLANDAIRGAVHFGRQSGRFEFRDVTFTSADPGFEIGARVRQSQPDGAILGLAANLFSGFREGLAADVPLVNIGADPLDTSIPAICSDDQTLLQMAVNHLTEAGYEQIAFVGLRGSAASQRRARLLGEMVDSLAVIDLDWPQRDIPPDIPSDPSIERWLSRFKRSVGVIAWNGHFALFVRAACRPLKLDVPRDVGLISLVDERRCLLGDPPITAVDVDGEKIGFEAMKRLAGLLAGRSPKTMTFPVPPRRIMTRESTATGPMEIENYIRRAQAYIDDHACQGIAVSDVLSALGPVSRSKFYDEFTRDVGRSPKAQILHVRLARACQLLAETELSITRISGMCGFHSGTRFGDAFRTELGQTPREYRKKHAAKKPRRKRKKGRPRE
jgi:LacI family transcriptional regulator